DRPGHHRGRKHGPGRLPPASRGSTVRWTAGPPDGGPEALPRGRHARARVLPEAKGRARQPGEGRVAPIERPCAGVAPFATDLRRSQRPTALVAEATRAVAANVTTAAASSRRGSARALASRSVPAGSTS